jgi:hypothetical protein
MRKNSQDYEEKNTVMESGDAKKTIIESNEAKGWSWLTQRSEKENSEGPSETNRKKKKTAKTTDKKSGKTHLYCFNNAHSPPFSRSMLYR